MQLQYWKKIQMHNQLSVNFFEKWYQKISVILRQSEKSKIDSMRLVMLISLQQIQVIDFLFLNDFLYLWRDSHNELLR